MPDQTVQTVPLLSKRRERALLVQKLQHGVPTVVLLFHGLTRLGEPHDWSRVVGVAEIIASALVIGAFSHRLRAVSRNTHAGPQSAHHGVDWIDLSPRPDAVRRDVVSLVRDRTRTAADPAPRVDDGRARLAPWPHDDGGETSPRRADRQ